MNDFIFSCELVGTLSLLEWKGLPSWMTQSFEEIFVLGTCDENAKTRLRIFAETKT